MSENIVWQYESKSFGDEKEWKEFDDDVELKLNDYLNEKSSQNPLKLDNYEINLVDMMIKDLKNKKTAQIRLLFYSQDDNCFYSWQWRDDFFKWKYYSCRFVAKLESSFKKLDLQCVLNLNAATNYLIDFKKMIQINQKTKFSRLIRRFKLDASNVKIEKRITRSQSKQVTSEETSTKTASLIKQEIKSEEEEEVVAVKRTRVKKHDLSERKSGKAKSSKDDDDVDEEVVIKKTKIEEIKDEKIEIIQFTGKIPVDQEAVNSIGNNYQVYIENDIPYDCMLNQTNLAQNNNKYYLLQLLENGNKPEYVVWFRWGRVGKSGQTAVHKCGTDLEKAKNLFCGKFFDKTKNDWDEKDQFEKIPGKYDIVQKDYSLDKEEDEKLKQALVESKKPIPKSKLDERIQRLVEFVCNVQEMEDLVREMKYDAKKAPLGKLSANQIKAGYQALKKIEEFIKNGKPNSKEFYEACNQFYTRIPHDFGMRVPTPINTVQLLKEKLSLLETLGDIEIAIKMLNKASTVENPIDRHYEQLDCVIKVLDKNDKVFKIIENYLQKTHAPTHCNYKMIIHDIFEVEKQQEKEKFKDVGNRMLLWHGSRPTNWAGILSTGLRIAPEEAPVTGYMFGKGCYFADSSSKSANYCYATTNKNIGLVSLSEVSLGTPNELKNADYDANKLPTGKHSTKGLGKFEPDKKEWITLDDGCVVPCGKLIPTGVQNTQGYTLMYNEYIVYDTSQIKLRYLCKIEFEFI